MNERPSYRQTFFRLLGFLKPYKWALGVSIVLAIVSQAAAVLIAFLTGDGLQEAPAELLRRFAEPMPEDRRDPLRRL